MRIGGSGEGQGDREMTNPALVPPVATRCLTGQVGGCPTSSSKTWKTEELVQVNDDKHADMQAAWFRMAAHRLASDGGRRRTSSSSPISPSGLRDGCGLRGNRGGWSCFGRC